MNHGKNNSPFYEIFHTQDIAVIGASNNPFKLGYHIVKNLIDQHKNVYPINPHIKHILKVKVFPTIKDVPTAIPLAILIVSPPLILPIIEECGERGVKYVIIVAEGFQESGIEGAKLQELLKKLLSKFNIRAIGPNTMGIHDTFTPLSTSFVNMSKLKQGNVSISSQTGILAGALLQYINLTKNIGINKVIDLGNMIDLNHADVLEFFMHDEKTQVIAMHLEGVSDGQRFAQALRAVTPKKPVIILKGGAMEETKRVVASHTGSLVGDDKLFDAMVKKAGAIRVKGFEEFVDVMKGFSYAPLPYNNQIAVITGSGGAAVITIDNFLKLGLKLAQFTPQTIEHLREYIPEPGKVLNPIDIWPAAISYGIDTIYARIISLLNEDPNVGAIIPLLFRVPDFPYDPMPIIDAAKRSVKPILFAIQGHATEQLRETFEKNGFATYSYGEQIVRVLKYMWDYKNFLGTIH
ncbi:MAG TPA: CoA-binding protein [Candidatus Deferrimicrobium sp.]|nr:CoA-binding protein [Candidatus Deferrimicrobium sp.]